MPIWDHLGPTSFTLRKPTSNNSRNLRLEPSSLQCHRTLAFEAPCGRRAPDRRIRNSTSSSLSNNNSNSRKDLQTSRPGPRLNILYSGSSGTLDEPFKRKRNVESLFW